MKIGLLGCKGTTLDLLHGIVSERLFSLDTVLTLPQHLGEKHGVAYYRGNEIAAYCQERAIPVRQVSSYELKDPEDERLIRETDLDVLLVIGWERLIPAHILDALGKFACGMHGSAYGLPRGRGRSPLNWSIITRQTKFVTYLIRYNAGVDAGDVIGFKTFEINPFDTIATLHLKNRIAMQQLLTTYMPLIEKDEVTYWPQPPVKPTYYPRRRPADSGIDWNQSTLAIYNLVRAVAPPYPPAFSFHDGKKIFILDAYPFDGGLFDHGIKPGTIVDVSISLGRFVVKTPDGTLIVREFSGGSIGDLRVGDVLTGTNQDEVLRQIVERYPSNVPDDEKEIRAPARGDDFSGEGTLQSRDLALA